jgi:hypothetical protein
MLTAQDISPSHAALQEDPVLHYAIPVTSNLASPQLKENNMKRFVMASVLACVLSGTALAGLIPSTGIVSPPPPPPDETATLGDIPSTGFTSPGEMPTCGLSILLTALDLVF